MPKGDSGKGVMKKKVLYLVSPKIKWETFKLLQEKLVRKEGPVPKEGDRVLWELLGTERIYCWFADDLPGDMGIGLKIPERYKNYKIMEITNPNPASLLSLKAGKGKNRRTYG